MQNNVTVSLKGGLGNQIFQILAGLNYGKKNNKSFFIDYNNDFHASQGNHPKNYEKNLFHKLNKGKITNNFKILREKKFKFEKLPFVEGDVILDGYFQSYKYFDKEDLDFISFNGLNKKIDKIKSFIDNNTVGVHVRGGDYKIYHKHNVITKNYYINAINEFNNYNFYAVTDDKKYAKSLLPNNIKIVDCGGEIEDFLFLVFCKNLIIANSSLSYISSLYGDKNKVCVPEKWFNDNTDTSDLYNKQLTKIKI